MAEAAGGQAGDAEGSWPEPVPLGEAAAVPPFPGDVLPAALARFVEETAGELGCPADLVGVPLLAVAGGALGNAVSLELSPAQTESAQLFAAVVAPAGPARSAALDVVRWPLAVMQERYLDNWYRGMQGTSWHRWAVRAKVPYGVPRRCLVGEVSLRELAEVLCHNRRGVVLVREDLEGLAAKLGPRSRGRDRQVLLTLWANSPLVLERKVREGPVTVPRPFTAIVGALAPAVLQRPGGGSKRGATVPVEGFLDRFLVAYPAWRPGGAGAGRKASPEALRAWTRTVEELLREGIDQYGERDLPARSVGLTAEGRQTWERLVEGHAAEMSAPGFPPALAGAWVGGRTYLARLGLIVHWLRRHGGEATGEEVDGVSMGRAGKLLAYFKWHARKAAVVAGADPCLGQARRLLASLVGRGRARFTRRDAYMLLPCSSRSLVLIDALLGLLEQHGLIRGAAAAARPPGRAGRKGSPAFELHPRAREALGAGRGPPLTGVPIAGSHSPAREPVSSEGTGAEP